MCFLFLFRNNYSNIYAVKSSEPKHRHLQEYQFYMLISIIIPVYNAANTIHNTLLSVMEQTGSDFEIIVIDDCSEDESVDIIKRTAENDSRVILIQNNVNQGVSASRNKGLAVARGEYIRFVDDDDPLPEGSVVNMYKVAKENDSDLVIGVMERVRLNKTVNIVATVSLGAKRVIDKYDPDLTQNFSVCNKMFRSDIIREHNLQFRDYRHAEDGLFLFEFLQYAEKINGCDNVIYSYRRPDTLEDPTATTMLAGGMLRDITEIADRILKMHAGAPDNFKEQFNRKITSSILIEKCYRKLWRLCDSDISFLLRELAKYRECLPKTIWDEVRAKHLDLCLEKGFFTKEEAYQNALFTIVIADSMDQDELLRLVHSAYYQRSPLFRIILPESCRHYLPDEEAEMPNVIFADIGKISYCSIVKTCDTPYITFIEDPVTFTFDTLFWTASLLQDERTGYVSGLCQRADDNKITTPEIYRYAYTKKNLGTSKKCTAADNADPLISNKVFRTEKLREYFQGSDESRGIDVKNLANAIIHERSRKVRYMTACSDPYLRGKMIKLAEDNLILSLVRVEPSGEKSDYSLKERVLFVSEKQEMKPAFKRLYDDYQYDKEVYVRETETEADTRLQMYAGYRTVIFERYDPDLTSVNIPEGQNCFVLINYLCRSKVKEPQILTELTLVKRYGTI